MPADIPNFWSVRFPGGPLALCRACYAVLVQEGSLAGDPREPALEAAHVLRASPLDPSVTDAMPTTCDNCESLKRYELHRPALQAPPVRLAGAPTPCTGGCGFHDCVANIPTSRELEGDDAPRRERPEYTAAELYGADL